MREEQAMCPDTAGGPPFAGKSGVASLARGILDGPGKIHEAYGKHVGVPEDH